MIKNIYFYWGLISQYVLEDKQKKILILIT